MTMVMKGKGCGLSSIGYYLVLAGAINWGLVGLGELFGSNWNVVSLIFGSMPMVEAIVYVIIGAAGILTCMGCPCSTCKVDAVPAMGEKK